jgi:malonyl-CoA O-methyltransferase
MSANEEGTHVSEDTRPTTAARHRDNNDPSATVGTDSRVACATPPGLAVTPAMAAADLRAAVPLDPSPAAFHLDRPAIRTSFDRASTRYEAAAVLQARVGDELLGRLDQFNFQPQVVLDLGAGTGRGTEQLKRRYRRAVVIALDMAPGMLREARRHQRLFRRFERVCGDALRLPFADSSVDVIFSSLMLQWCDPLDVAFSEVRRVLKPEGFFAFSTFGPDTLKELRAAWAEADGYNHVNQFTDMHDVGEALVRAGLTEPVLDIDRTRLTYPNTVALMKDLKAIGAHNVTAGRSRGLTGRARLARVEAAYESYRRDGRLPATYEIIYGATWGAAGRAGLPAVHGEVRISPSAIKRRAPR